MNHSSYFTSCAVVGMVSHENRIIAAFVLVAFPAGLFAEWLLESVGFGDETSFAVAMAVLFVVGIIVPQTLVNRGDD